MRSIKSRVEDVVVCLLLFNSACRPSFPFLTFALCLLVVLLALPAGSGFVADLSTGNSGFTVVRDLEGAECARRLFVGKVVTFCLWQISQMHLIWSGLFVACFDGRWRFTVGFILSCFARLMVLVQPMMLRLPQAVHHWSRRALLEVASQSSIKEMSSDPRCAEVDGAEIARYLDAFSRKAACKSLLLTCDMVECLLDSAFHTIKT